MHTHPLPWNPAVPTHVAARGSRALALAPSLPPSIICRPLSAASVAVRVRRVVSGQTFVGGAPNSPSKKFLRLSAAKKPTRTRTRIETDGRSGGRLRLGLQVYPPLQDGPR